METYYKNRRSYGLADGGPSDKRGLMRGSGLEKVIDALERIKRAENTINMLKCSSHGLTRKGISPKYLPLNYPIEKINLN